MAGVPTTTIVPFTNTKLLPSCATACGALYDANGGCVPPAANLNKGATAYTSCFCSNTAVTAFSSAATGVCDEACGSDGLSSIATWFQSICSVNQKNNNNNNNDNNEDSNDSSEASATATAKASSGGGGDWLSNHWQWVIFLVIMVVAIIGIWIGACIWRRRYLRKKDRQFSLGQKHSGSASHPSWGPGVGPDSEAAPSEAAPAGYDSQRNSHAILTPGNVHTSVPPSAPVPANAADMAAATEKPKGKNKKRWIVKERT